MKIAIVGSESYTNAIKIKETIYDLKNKYSSDLTILSAGSVSGADYFIKKSALSFEISYIEFNPSHTKKNQFSAMPNWWYNKKYKSGNFFARNKLIVESSELIIAFLSRNNHNTKVLDVIKKAKKSDIPVIIIY